MSKARPAFMLDLKNEVTEVNWKSENVLQNVENVFDLKWGDRFSD